MKDWSASSFQNRSSEVAHPLLEIVEVITGGHVVRWEHGIMGRRFPDGGLLRYRK